MKSARFFGGMMKKIEELTTSANIATVPMPFAIVRRAPWNYRNEPPHYSVLKRISKPNAKDNYSKWYHPFMTVESKGDKPNPRSQNISPTRMNKTDTLIKKGVAPLEKTPSGKSSGEDYIELNKTLYKDVDTIPPKSVAKEAEKGLELRKWNEQRKKLPKGDPRKLPSSKSLGGTDIGVSRAVQLMKYAKEKKELPARSIYRMASYFGRHTGDLSAPGFADDEKPSAGYVAHLLWGGDAGQKWANDTIDKMNKVDRDLAEKLFPSLKDIKDDEKRKPLMKKFRDLKKDVNKINKLLKDLENGKDISQEIER